MLMGTMAIDIHLGRRPMKDYALPLARMSRWKWQGGLGYNSVWRMRVLLYRIGSDQASCAKGILAPE